MKPSLLLLIVFGWCSLSVHGQPTAPVIPPLGRADSLRMWTLRHIGDSLTEVNQLSRAKQSYDQALALALETGHPGAIGSGYRGIGYWYGQVGDYPQSIAYYQRAMAAYKPMNNPRSLARTMYLLSTGYLRLRNVKLARHYAEAGLQLAQQANAEGLVIEFYEQLAILAGDEKHYGPIDGYSAKVLAYYRQQQDWPSYYTALFNSALTDKNRGLFARSEAKFRQVIAYATEHNDNYLLLFALSGIPYALIGRNKLDEAEQYARQALARAEKSGVSKHDLLAEINGHLSQIAEKRGDFRQALSFYKQQIANRDSVFNETKSRQLAELETRFETRQKEADITRLAAVNALQTRQIWFVGSGLLLMTLLLGGLYRLYRRVQGSRAKIQQQADQMGLLMKELHHRVKNNLAIVSSLLKLQSNRLDDEKAIQAVRVGQQRVEAMSLIHQRLYQTDTVTTVNMRDYLTDLTRSLLHAYGYQPDEVDLRLHVGQPHLDVDTAIPLGLIVNELATNAFKYAYTNQAGNRPMLAISLQPDKEQLMLEVRDNGPGIDRADWQQQGEKSSFGKRLIASLCEQLDGEFTLHKQNGTVFRLRMPAGRQNGQAVPG